MLRLDYFMSVPYRGRKAYKEPQCEELHRELSEVSDELDTCCQVLKELVPKFQDYADLTLELQKEVISLRPKKRGRPKKK